MKNGKNPTVRQMKFIKDHGRDPTKWRVVKDTPDVMVIVSKESRLTCTFDKKKGEWRNGK